MHNLWNFRPGLKYIRFFWFSNSRESKRHKKANKKRHSDALFFVLATQQACATLTPVSWNSGKFLVLMCPLIFKVQEVKEITVWIINLIPIKYCTEYPYILTIDLLRWHEYYVWIFSMCHYFSGNLFPSRFPKIYYVYIQYYYNRQFLK